MMCCFSEGVFRADAYIIPPMGGWAIPAAGFSSFWSATRLSVVRTMAATEAAFCRALRVTLVGSTMPLSSISTYWSL